MDWRVWRRRRRPLVTVLRLVGTIGSLPARGGLTAEGLEPLIEKAFAPKRLTAVALIVNSPGGSPVQSALIADRIRSLADEKKVPVLCFVEDVAASGGYWLATAADEIFADPSSIVGSIGVISAGFGFTGLAEKLGVERRLQTAGTRKSLMDPFLPVEPADRDRLQRVLAEIHDRFKIQVRSRRGERLKAPEEELFTGEFWTGGKALELGLIDGLASAESLLRQRYGAKVRIHKLAPRRRLFPLRLSLKAEGAPEALLAAVETRAHWGRYGL